LDALTTCTATTQMCSLCAAGFGSTGYVPWGAASAVCTPCPAGFWNDGNTPGPCSACSLCPKGYYSTSVSGQACSTTNSPCLSCQDAPNCLSTHTSCSTSSNSYCDWYGCAPSSTWAGNGVCISCPFISGCQSSVCSYDPNTFLSSSTCIQCSPGYFLSSDGLSCGGCWTGSINSYCASYSCPVSVMATNCNLCSNGILITNCAAYTCYATTATCLACKAGFFYNSSSGFCQQCQQIGSCQSTVCKAASDQNCTLCVSGWFITSGVCQACSICSPGSYDISQSSVSSCSETANTVCYACTPIPNCVISYCNAPNATICTQCLAGYYINGAGTQLSVTSCTGCSPPCNVGQYVATPCNGIHNRVCAACPTGTYSAVTGSTSCSTCSTCNSGFYASTPCSSTANTVCTACAIPNCYNVNCATTYQSCTSCNTGYYINSQRTCTLCSSCASGTYVYAACTATLDISCAACPAMYQCQSVTCSSSTSYYCTYCNYGYYLSGGSCYQTCPTILNCWVCSGGVRCSQCAPNYHVNTATYHCSLNQVG